jgi:hypothetical protein
MTQWLIKKSNQDSLTPYANLSNCNKISVKSLSRVNPFFLSYQILTPDVTHLRPPVLTPDNLVPGSIQIPSFKK